MMGWLQNLRAKQGQNDFPSQVKERPPAPGRVEAAYFVYVGQGSAGIIKVGMSCNPHRRCRKDFGIDLVGAVKVTREAAKEVETYALRALGARSGDTEWVRGRTGIEAMAAVKRARDEVGRFMHADPDLTPEEARIARSRGSKK
jgi:hypothetical protein